VNIQLPESSPEGGIHVCQSRAFGALDGHPDGFQVLVFKFGCIYISDYLHTVNMGIHHCIHLHIVLRLCLSTSSNSPPSSFHYSRNARSDWSDDTVVRSLEAALGTYDKASCVRRRKGGNSVAVKKGSVPLEGRSRVLEESEVAIMVDQVCNRRTTEQTSSVRYPPPSERVREIEISYNDRRIHHNQYRD
jgi:hypothetical protein